MKRDGLILLGFILISFTAGQVVSAPQEKKRSKVSYKVEYKDPAIEEMRERNRKAKEERDKVTSEIRDVQKKRREQERKVEKILTFDYSGVEVPESPEVFKSAFHFPPIPQYYTGTCWAFATTSFLESELARLAGKKIKLSEMHTVYYEYLEKARRYIQERGDSFFNQGSESNAVTRIWKKYGAVPASVYGGDLSEDRRHDHSEMYGEMKAYLGYVMKQNSWDEKTILETLKVILDKYMGPPPEEFQFSGGTVTPRGFLDDVLQLKMDDYVAIISTLKFPFYTRGEYEVPDNWWHSKDYYNVPLDEFHGLIKKAIQAGYTVALGGDVSEPGYQGFEDAAIVPEFDIPQEFINQESREFRFYNKTTEDDHLIHLVGYAEVGGRDWFLIKDSSRSARWGKFEGLYFYRDDYIKLKMLTAMFHRDVLNDILGKFKENPGAP